MNDFLEFSYPISFLVGIIFIVISLITRILPPKKINALYGYRTLASMKNQETWDFAQRYSSNKMIHAGLFLIVVSFLKIVIEEKHEILLNLLFLFLATLYLLFTTERAIKNKFN
ncbi:MULTISPECIES: SdpI family protein [Flavobacterium]|uniref:SdpI family protein n=1 Tax=Flavobacterium hankyongi TaxID=1176532 RepID=A0ABP8ZNR8_9FLAO|nr:SdpI family protein [Flavobacterium sp. N1846]